MANPNSEIVDANAANVRRAQHAANALMVWLRRDPRVQQAYKRWRGAIEDREFQSIVDDAERLVRDELGLSYDWLPRLLAKDWALQGHLVLEADIPGDWPPGKEKGGAELIARGVGWFYRAEIKDPKDSKRSLAVEYQQALEGRREGDGRSTVIDAIARTKQLLAVLSLDDTPLSE